MKRASIIPWIALLSFVLGGCAAESTGLYDMVTTVTIENDVLTGSDNNYTNGLGVTWATNELKTYDEGSFIRRWGDFWSFLPFVGDDGYETYAAWSVAQEMHTPDDISNPNPPLDDQPYAGILYADNVLYARGERWTHAWNLRFGVVGPHSHADNVQKEFHELVGDDEPMGWHTQLPNEAIINVDYTAAHVLAQGSVGRSASWKLVPVLTAGLGNYFTGIGAGLYAEVGWNLVDALGGTALREGFNAASTVGVGPVDRWSLSFSGGLAAYGVSHYLPLDGTVFRDSHGVDSESSIGMGTLGISARRRGLVIAFTKTFYTDTFATERENAEFGTLSVSWYF